MSGRKSGSVADDLYRLVMMIDGWVRALEINCR